MTSLTAPSQQLGPAMDAIRKKMQTMKAETDELYKKIAEYEAATDESNAASEKLDCEIRDLGKKVAKLDTRMEETVEALQQSGARLEEAEAEFKDKEDEVGVQARRATLLEEETRASEEKMAGAILRLAVLSKDADNIVKVQLYKTTAV